MTHAREGYTREDKIMPDKLYTPQEVAERLGVRRNTVYKLMRSQRLSFTLVGEKQYRISGEQLQEYIKRNTVQQAQ